MAQVRVFPSVDSVSPAASGFTTVTPTGKVSMAFAPSTAVVAEELVAFRV